MKARTSRLRKLARKIREVHDEHLERRRPSGFEFAIADRLSALNPQLWDEVAGRASVFLSRPYLQLLEEHGPRSIAPRYAIVLERGRPLAILSAQLFEVAARPIVEARNKRKEAERKPKGDGESTSERLKQSLLKPAKRMRDAAISRLDIRALVCGNLLSWGFHGVAFAPNVDPLRVWPGVAEAIDRIRRAEKLNGQTDIVLFKDLREGDASGIEELDRFGYESQGTDPDMVLSIPATWSNYEDYLGDLKAKYRKAARKTIKEIDSAGCVVERLDELGPHSARLHELYCAVQARADFRPVLLPETFFPALKAALGEAVRVVVIRQQDQILGFVTTIRDGETAIGYYLGVDYEANERSPIYLRLMHAVIEDAIDLGCKRLSFGRTALEPKSRLGAQPEALNIWLRHRVPVLDAGLKQLLRFVPQEEAPDRNPFKGNS